MNITLIGMPGVGKSTIGRNLARKLGCKFVDIDKIIEKKTKLKLQKVLDKLGDKKFLQLEEETILELGNFENCLISPGGSAIYSTKAMKFLREKSIIIFLDDSLENIRSRISNFSTRGIVGLKKKNLKKLFNGRRILYKKYADITIKMPKNFNLGKIVKDIIEKITSNKLYED